MERILVTRFSAMGDVAMVASVLSEFQERHQDTEIILVSRAFFSPFFDEIPRLVFHPFDPKGPHRGVLGLIKLYKELKVYQSNKLADLHNNLRSRFLNFLFKNSGYHVEVLNKGRKEKKALTRKRDKVFRVLRHTSERYADVLRALGYPITLSHTMRKHFRLIPQGMTPILASAEKKVGIAPFAQHPYKVFPLNKMENVIRSLSQAGVRVLFFGGGDRERQITEQWEKDFPGSVSLIGKYSLRDELDIIAHLDLMISMDSSGMHMASLMGIPCLSIWGATHPYAGFLGYGQAMENCIQADHPSRPSSVYGNKPCLCDGIEAINLVESESIVKLLLKKLNLE
ncbi:MAG: glycosyltransferase family 9 protein [Sphingobacterium sp.]